MPPRTVRIQEEIAGRAYRIEVASVATDRWRARVIASRGGGTSVMPFYGPTPEAAASQLSAWLARVHRATVRPRP
jgi:IS1 family transposase